MNPCANKFTPLSTPVLGSSSSALALDDDHHGPQLETLSSEQTQIQTTVPLHNPNRPLTPRHTPFHGLSSLYPGISLRNHAVPQPGWSMPPWYNPVAVAGPYCPTPTPSHPQPGSFIYGSVVPSLTYTDRAFHTVAANSRPGFGPIMDIEQTQTRTQQPRRRVIKKSSDEPSTHCHQETSSQSLVSSSNSLPSTASNVMGGSESWKSREGVLKQPVSAKSTRERLQYNDCSHLDFGSCLSSTQQSSTCSKSPSPPWSESVLPLFSNDFPIPIGNMTDNPRQQSSLFAFADADSIPFPQYYKESGLPPRSACRNAASPGSSKPRKTPSQDTAPLLRPKMRSWDLEKAEALPQVSLEKIKHKTTALPVVYSKQAEYSQAYIRNFDSYANDGEWPRLEHATQKTTALPVEHSKQAESSQAYIRNFDSYASDGDWPRLETQSMKSFVPAISVYLHSKLQLGRKVLADVGMAMQRSRSEDGATTNSIKNIPHKGAFSAINGHMQSSVVGKEGEGSWSQSKRWVSPETKEREAFDKMKQNLHHIGADNSPFVPKKPHELAALRAEMTEIKRRRLLRKVEWRRATLGRRRAVAEDAGEQHTKLVPFLCGKKFPDNLSPVFASQNCFREHISHDDAQWVIWPSLAELKEVGDKRPGRQERYLPLPMLNIDVKGYVTYQGENSYLADDIDLGGMRGLKVDTRFVGSISPITEPLSPQATELVFEELPSYLQKAIVDMEEELDD